MADIDTWMLSAALDFKRSFLLGDRRDNLAWMLAKGRPRLYCRQSHGNLHSTGAGIRTGQETLTETWHWKPGEGCFANFSFLMKGRHIHYQQQAITERLGLSVLLIKRTCPLHHVHQSLFREEPCLSKLFWIIIVFGDHFVVSPV